MSFEWGWNPETIGTVIVGLIVFIFILIAIIHLETDVPDKAEVRKIIRQELQRFYKEKQEEEKQRS